MPYPKGTYIIIEIDPAQLGPSGKKEDVKCFSNLQIEAECTWTSDTTIKIDGLVKDNLVANTHISLMLTNFEIKVKEPLVTKSWEVTSFTSDNFFIESRK